MTFKECLHTEFNCQLHKNGFLFPDVGSFKVYLLFNLAFLRKACDVKELVLCQKKEI